MRSCYVRVGGGIWTTVMWHQDPCFRVNQRRLSALQTSNSTSPRLLIEVMPNQDQPFEELGDRGHISTQELEDRQSGVNREMFPLVIWIFAFALTDMLTFRAFPSAGQISVTFKPGFNILSCPPLLSPFNSCLDGRIRWVCLKDWLKQYSPSSFFFFLPWGVVKNHASQSCLWPSLEMKGLSTNLLT